MTASHTQRQAPPWYRQFWPWFLLALPATAVAAGIATLIIAASDPDGLVVDDYYKEGLAINQALERDRQAQALGLSGLARLDPAAGRIVVTLNGSGAVARDDAPARPTIAGAPRSTSSRRAAGTCSWNRPGAAGASPGGSPCPTSNRPCCSRIWTEAEKPEQLIAAAEVRGRHGNETASQSAGPVPAG